MPLPNTHVRVRGTPPLRRTARCRPWRPPPTRCMPYSPEKRSLRSLTIASPPKKSSQADRALPALEASAAALEASRDAVAIPSPLAAAPASASAAAAAAAAGREEGGEALTMELWALREQARRPYILSSPIQSYPLKLGSTGAVGPAGTGEKPLYILPYAEKRETGIELLSGSRSRTLSHRLELWPLV